MHKLSTLYIPLLCMKIVGDGGQATPYFFLLGEGSIMNDPKSSYLIIVEPLIVISAAAAAEVEVLKVVSLPIVELSSIHNQYTL